MDNQNEELEKLRAQLAEKEQIELSLKAELANKDIQFEQSELAKKELQKENEILKEKEIINKKIPDKDKDKDKDTDKDKEAQDKAEQEKQAQADKEAQAKEEQAKKDQADKDDQTKKESQSKEEQAKKEQADKEAQAKEEQAKKDQEKEPDKGKEVNQIADKVVAEKTLEEKGIQDTLNSTLDIIKNENAQENAIPDLSEIGNLGARFERSQQRHTSDCKVRDEIKAMSPEQYKELETKMNKEHGKEGQKLTHEGVVAFACEDKHKELGIQRDSMDKAVARSVAPGVAEEMDKRAAARYEPDKEAIKAKEAERPPEIKPNLGQSNDVGMSR